MWHSQHSCMCEAVQHSPRVGAWAGQRASLVSWHLPETRRICLAVGLRCLAAPGGCTGTGRKPGALLPVWLVGTATPAERQGPSASVEQWVERALCRGPLNQGVCSTAWSAGKVPAVPQACLARVKYRKE